MSLLPPPKGCPPAYGGCTCSCHRVPGTLHVVACCSPRLNIDREWLKRKIGEDGDEGEIGAGFELFPLAERKEPTP